MRLELESTAEVLAVGGKKVRVYRALTERGTPCFALVHSLAVNAQRVGDAEAEELDALDPDVEDRISDLDRLAIESTFRKLETEGLRYFPRLDLVSGGPMEIVDGVWPEPPRPGEIAVGPAGTRDEVRFRHWLDGKPLSRGSLLEVVRSSRFPAGTRFRYESELRSVWATADLILEQKLQAGEVVEERAIRRHARRDEVFRWVSSDEVLHGR